MSRVLLIGYDPPPFVADAKIEAAHYRTLQFLLPLLDDGHAVCLCGGARGAPAGVPPAGWRERLAYRPIAFGGRGWRAALQTAHDDFAPDCVVAVSFSHCLYATALRTGRPLWMDVYGDMLTIVQAALFRSGSDRGLRTSLAFMRAVLRAGDAFSGCGTPQRDALVGELAMCGRLNRHTFGYDLAHAILPGALPTAGARRGAAARRTLRAAHGIADDDFVVLWSGGYNTWTDVGTLFRGVELAMQRNPRVRYVSVGAATYDAPDNTYARLCALVAGSPRRDRFHLLGWRPWSELPDHYAASDAGINIDARHYETSLGTRTRLLEMIAAELPVLTTEGTELSRLLREQGAALTFPIGDWQALAAQIVALASDAELGRRVAAAGRACAEQTLSFAATTAPLRAWVRQPTHAPDKLHRPPRIEMLQHRLRTLVRLALWKAFCREK